MKDPKRQEAIRNIFQKIAAKYAVIPGPDDKPIEYHAVFSLQAAFEYGSGIWLTTDGREVEVTCVDESRENLYKIYQWKDKVYVGLVTKRLRQGMPDQSISSYYSSYYFPQK